MTMSAISRKPLLTAALKSARSVQRVEIKEIELAPGQKTGAHLHRCPVVGYVVAGSILFRIDLRPPIKLEAGDAFYEPPDAKVLHFDNTGTVPARFVAFYLMGREDHELITMLD
jgi:quercetin dioxygenase-like cupin family protein